MKLMEYFSDSNIGCRFAVVQNTSKMTVVSSYIDTFIKRQA